MLQQLNRPWLHFLLAGSLLFFASRALYPPPRPVLGPLPQEQIENLKMQWFRSTGRLPDRARLRELIAAELDREMLFQRALALKLQRYDPVVRQRLLRNMHFLGLAQERAAEELYREALRLQLHLGDEVIKRRLIQVMEQLLLARRPAPAPSSEELQTIYRQQLPTLRRPLRYSIEHLYFPRHRHAEIAAVATRLQAQQLSAAAARQFSSPFLPGYRFNSQSAAQLARHFGADFVRNLELMQPTAGRWLGPVESTYGWHLVWVEQIEPARAASFAEVRDQLRRDLMLARRRAALRRAVAGLREDYEVRL